MIKYIKKLSTKYVLSALLLFLAFLSGSIYSEALPTILPIVLQAMPKILMLKLLLMATTICILLFAFSLVFYLKLKRKLVLKFGIFWDKKAEPYCPICKTPLQVDEHAFTFNEVNLGSLKLTCLKCEKSIPIRDDNSQYVPFKMAKELVLKSK